MKKKKCVAYINTKKKKIIIRSGAKGTGMKIASEDIIPYIYRDVEDQIDAIMKVLKRFMPLDLYNIITT